MRKKTKNQNPEEFIAKLLRRQTAGRKAYWKWLEEHADALIDPDLGDGSEPPLPNPVKHPAADEDIIIKLLKREVARRKLDLWWFLQGFNAYSDDRVDLSKPVSDLVAEEPGKRRNSERKIKGKRKPES
jgi:hypothetical protein